MPSAALTSWQQGRAARLLRIDQHCREVDTLVPPDPEFLDETLRGYVLHLSAHFQGFCRDLYTESSQFVISSIPAGLQQAIQTQCNSQLALEKSNPSYDNIRKDFFRFQIELNLRAVHPNGDRDLTDLNHLNNWRNRAAHQATTSLPPGTPLALNLTLIQKWAAACSSLANSMDSVVRMKLFDLVGTYPW